jgi:hypothetical protein
MANKDAQLRGAIETLLDIVERLDEGGEYSIGQIVDDDDLGELGSKFVKYIVTSPV